MVQPSAKCLNTTIVIMLGITTIKRVQVGIDALWTDGIANQVFKDQLVDSYGLRACARCSGFDKLVKKAFCELFTNFCAWRE